MKIIKLTAIAGMTYLILLSSCSKEKDAVENAVVKKCNDSTSTNFNKEGDCIYPADKLVGNWNVTEYTMLPGPVDTNYFTASITKKSNSKVFVENHRTDNPPYINPYKTLEINWPLKSFDNMQPGNLNSIDNDNYFKIIFFKFDGAGRMEYIVSQRFSR
jgi:hypothetical protein